MNAQSINMHDASGGAKPCGNVVATVNDDGVVTPMSTYMFHRRPTCSVALIGVLFLNNEMRPIGHHTFSAAPLGDLSCADRISIKAQRVDASYVVCVLTDTCLFDQELEDDEFSEDLRHSIYSPSADPKKPTWQALAHRLEADNLRLLRVYVFGSGDDSDEYVLAWNNADD